MNNKDITFVCPNCKQTVTWEPVALDNDILLCLDWTCKNCGEEVIQFYNEKGERIKHESSNQTRCS